MEKRIFGRKSSQKLDSKATLKYPIETLFRSCGFLQESDNELSKLDVLTSLFVELEGFESLNFGAKKSPRLDRKKFFWKMSIGVHTAASTEVSTKAERPLTLPYSSS